jgi:hypothetical protein
MSKELWNKIDFLGFKVTNLPEVVDFLSCVMPQKHFDGKLILPKSCSKFTASLFKDLRNVSPKLTTLAVPPPFGEVSSISNSTLKQISQFTNLKQLEMINHRKITDLGMDTITKKLKDLTLMVLDGCTNLTAQSLILLFQRCPKIQQISLLAHDSDVGVVVEEVHLLEMISEKRLSLKTCCLEFGRISHQTLVKFVEQCPNIEKLCLKGFSSMDAKSVEILLSLKKLREFIVCSSVSLYSPRIESSSLEHLHFSRLTRLSSPIIKCSKLKKLSFEQCSTIEYMDLKSIQTLQCLQVRTSKLLSVDLSEVSTLPKLKELEFFDLKMPNTQELEIHSSSLEKFILVMCEDLLGLSLKCSILRTLSLDLCSELQRLSVVCPKMDSIQLFILPQTQFPKLNEIHVESNELVTLNLQRATLLEKASFECSKLDALNLSGCRVLKELPNLKCPKLDKLAIGSPHVEYSTEKVKSFTTFCPSISMLSISNAENLNDECLAELCDRLNHLQALVISNCQSLKSPNLEAPNLKGF